MTPTVQEGAPAPYRVETGPGWELRCGDCLDPVTGLASLADRGVDHVISDPPYDEHTHGAMRRGATGRDKSKGLAKTTISFERHCGFASIPGSAMEELSVEVQRASARWCLLFSAMEQQADWRFYLEAAGMEHVRFGIWHKPGSTPQFTGDRPGTATEAIEIAHPRGRKRWNGGGGFAMWSEPIVKHQTGERCHPTQKPLALMEALVSDFTDPGELVCDPFSGSGTTGVACIRLGRRFIGWEREPRYFDVAVKRLRAAREQFRLPLATGPAPKQATLLESAPLRREEGEGG